jgi:hypothetical protein
VVYCIFEPLFYNPFHQKYNYIPLSPSTLKTRSVVPFFFLIIPNHYVAINEKHVSQWKCGRHSGVSPLCPGQSIPLCPRWHQCIKKSNEAYRLLLSAQDSLIYYVYMQPLVRTMLVRCNVVHFKFIVYMHSLVRI